MSYSTNEKVLYQKKKKKERIKSRKCRIHNAKSHIAARLNREKGNGILAHADQIRPLGEYEEQNEEEIYDSYC